MHFPAVNFLQTMLSLHNVSQHSSPMPITVLFTILHTQAMQLVCLLISLLNLPFVMPVSLDNRQRLVFLRFSCGKEHHRSLVLMEQPNTLSATGNKYIMNIIDDFSSYAWSIPLAAKSDTFPALLTWERARKLETTLKVDSLSEWLLTRETQHQFMAPYTSAQNGCVERLHCTLIDKARAMCTAYGVPPNCWDEFVLTVYYLSNCTSVASQSGHTPYEC